MIRATPGLDRLFRFLILLPVALLAAPAFASQPLHLNVDGLGRDALVFPPANASTAPAPLILVYHGHGGGMGGTARQFRFQDAWPAAVVVYLQGLPSQTPNDPNGKRPGWQIDAGQSGDRDLKFTDEVLAWAQAHYHVDSKRTFAVGFSNGAGFSFLLWSERPNRFSGFGVVANSIRDTLHIRVAKPLIHIAGRNDDTAKFERQLQSIETAKRINGVTASERCGESCTRYTTPAADTPVVAVFHPGGHVVPPWAGARMVEFFQHHSGH